MDSYIKRIWAASNLIAPRMKLTPEEYKFRVVSQGAGRVNGSVKNLHPIEFEHVWKLIVKDAQELKVDLNGNNQQPNETDLQADTMRKKIISMLREIGYETKYNNKIVADMQRIYTLIKSKGFKKPKGLNEYTYEELPKLVSQIEAIYVSELKKIRKNA